MRKTIWKLAVALCLLNLGKNIMRLSNLHAIFLYNIVFLFPTSFISAHFEKVSLRQFGMNRNQFRITLMKTYCRPACNFIKKETLEKVFSCEFCKISKNTFFKEHLRATASTSLKALSLSISSYSKQL